MYIHLQQYLRTISGQHTDIVDARLDDYATREDVAASKLEYPAAMVETPYLTISGDADSHNNIWTGAVAILINTTSDDADRIIHAKQRTYTIARDLLKLIELQHDKEQNAGIIIHKTRLEEIPMQHGDNMLGWRLEVQMYDCEQIDITGKFGSEDYIPLTFDYTVDKAIMYTEVDYKLYVDGIKVEESTNKDAITIPDRGDIYLEVRSADGQVASARWTSPSTGKSRPYHYNPY